MKIYSKRKLDKNGCIEIKYQQSNKYGRYNVKYGLQNFQSDIRKYISGEYYIDCDFVNCHPVILNQLLKSNNSKLTSTDCVHSL